MLFIKKSTPRTLIGNSKNTVWNALLTSFVVNFD